MDNPKRGRDICRHWARGFCSFGEKCIFAHPSDQGEGAAAYLQRARHTFGSRGHGLAQAPPNNNDGEPDLSIRGAARRNDFTSGFAPPPVQLHVRSLPTSRGFSPFDSTHWGKADLGMGEQGGQRHDILRYNEKANDHGSGTYDEDMFSAYKHSEDLNTIPVSERSRKQKPQLQCEERRDEVGSRAGLPMHHQISAARLGKSLPDEFSQRRRPPHEPPSPRRDPRSDLYSSSSPSSLSTPAAAEMSMAPVQMLQKSQNGVHGPHPSYIQVANPYIFEQKVQDCLKALGSGEAKEDNIRLQGILWIDGVRKALQL